MDTCSIDRWLEKKTAPNLEAKMFFTGLKNYTTKSIYCKFFYINAGTQQ